MVKKGHCLAKDKTCNKFNKLGYLFNKCKLSNRSQGLGQQTQKKPATAAKPQ